MGKLFRRGILLTLTGLTVSVFAHTNPTSNTTQNAQEICEGALTGARLVQAKLKWAGKTVIFDTNVLLNDPYAVYKYPGAQIVISGTVFEEVDDHKNDDKTAKMSRTLSRVLEELVQSGKGNLKSGIKLPDGGTLKLDSTDYTHVLDQTTYNSKKKDNEILATALAYTYKTSGYGNVFLISNDRNVRLKAAAEEILALPFEYELGMPASTPESGIKTVELTSDQLNQFRTTGELPKPADLKLIPNEFVKFKMGQVVDSPDLVARYVYDRENPEKSSLRKLGDFSKLPFQPKNIEQSMALDLLLDPNVTVVIMQAKMGTGKTFLALMAAMLQMRGENPLYKKLRITRPLVHLGKVELGALPGGKDEKLKEHFNSYYDNLSVLTDKMAGKTGEGADANSPVKTPAKPLADMSRSERREYRKAQQSGDQNKVKLKGSNIELLPFPHIRGRTLPDSFVIVDEFQNTSKHEAKTMLTRVGAGSKIVVLGDPGQIDPPFLNERNNGLSVTSTLYMNAEGLTDEERSRVGFVQLFEGVRSPESEIFSKVFDQDLTVEGP